MRGFVALFLVSCAASPAAPPRAAEPSPSQEENNRARAAAFSEVEGRAIAWMAAADPRLATRLGAIAPKELLDRIGTEAVLAEDATAQIRGASLDLFAFPSRVRALEQAAKLVTAFGSPLSDVGSAGSPLARPKLERELLLRVVEEEAARTAEETKLGDASGDLVRAIVAVWAPPATPEDVRDRDGWVSRHLLEVRASLREGRTLTGPMDLDAALYPLERLLAPLEYPRGSAAIAQVRVALDADMRAVPPIALADRVARGVKAHLGVAVEPLTLRPRLDRVEVRLRDLAAAALAATGDGRRAVEGRARALLFSEKPCLEVPGSRVRAAAPPPERAAICGAVRALVEEPIPALVALHDDVLLAIAAVDRAPPPRTGLLSKPEDEVVDSLRRAARERPVVALGIALAAELLYAEGDAAAIQARLNAWRALGEVPLDVVAREVDVR
jgi:hypothetical protein